MAYQPRSPSPPMSLIGNPGSAPAVGSPILLGADLAFSGSTLEKVPAPVRNITDTYTLQISDVGRSIVVNSAHNIDFYLPRSFPRGFKARVYQAGAGQVSFHVFGGGTILNSDVVTGAIATLGSYTNGYFADIENVGNDAWVILGNTAAGILNWDIYGDTSVKEGDCAGFCINYPDAIIGNFPAGITITVTGTNFDTAGFDRTLVQGLKDAVLLDPTHLSFDGTSVLTVKKGAANPIALNFFAVPDYTETSDRTATLTISAASHGSIAGSSLDCLVLDVSKPTSPDLLFPTTTLTTVGSAASGQPVINVTDATGLVQFGTVTGTGIAALTWITNISGNTITLSANLTGTISAAASLTYTPPGFWFDFSTSSNITKDGSNNVSQAVDLINGYTINQATGANKPVWNATALNSLGGLVFNGAKWLAATVANQFTKTSSGDVAANGTAITLTSVTSVAAGMLVTDSGGLINASTTVASVVGSVVNLSQPITNNILPSGSTITFTPAASKHPLVNILDAINQKFTVVIVAELSAADTSFYAGWDAINFQCNATSNHAFIGNAAAQENVSGTSAVGCPYVWQYVSDGQSQQVFINGQNPITTATLTTLAPSNGGTGFTLNVDDTSGIATGSVIISSVFGLNQRVDTVVSSTEILVTHNPLFTPWIAADLPIGTTVSVQSRALGSNAKTSISQQFVLGSLVGTGFSAYCRGDQVDFTAEPGGCVVGGTSAFPFKGTIFEMIVVPRMLGLQEMRGLTQYLATKWGAATTANVSSASAGATSIQLASASGIYYGQVLDATTGILAGTMVTGVNGSTHVVKLDTPVQAPGLTTNQALTFRSPGFKRPNVIDVSQFYPTFRDDFHNLNLGSVWFPYYGDPGNPGTFSTAYGAAGHGSSNNPPSETEWYLDVLNWVPWQQYTPFSLESPMGARSGEVVITATPAPPEIANLIGYVPPDPIYHYISGFLVNYSYSQQYGYWECRAKCPSVRGMWPAYWMTTASGGWPPEVDIMELNDGSSPGAIGGALHSSNGVPYGDAGHMLLDASSEHVLYGVEVGAISIDMYINREKYASFPTPADFHIFWKQQFNMAVHSYADPTSSPTAQLRVDYVGAWRRLPQTQTVPTATQLETTALIAAMTNQSLPTGRAALINTVIASLKTYKIGAGPSFWDALDFLYLTAAHDAQAARINWKTPTHIGTEVGSPTFAVDRGYRGAYGTSYVDTGINLSTSGFQMTAAQNHIGAAGNNLSNISDPQSSSIGTAVAGVENASTYNMRLGCFAVFGRALESGSNWAIVMQPNFAGGGAGSLIGRSGYAVASRYEASRQLYAIAPSDINGNPVYDKVANNVPGDTKPALDNANLVIANANFVGVVSCAHGGVFLSQDDIEILYNVILYPYLHTIGAL